MMKDGTGGVVLGGRVRPKAAAHSREGRSRAFGGTVLVNGDERRSCARMKLHKRALLANNTTCPELATDGICTQPPQIRA